MVNLGQKYLAKAKKIIPGGNQLLSKRSEIFLPNFWPNYFKKAKGCKITDLENKTYYDFAGMGVTACVVGYCDKDIDKSVKKTISLGSMTTLNSLDELKLAKEILKIHPWASMTKFCKSGGEACMIAIRIARAYTKKQGIAFCGYHGWHDWYLSANLEDQENLGGHLLPGLDPKGVPENLRGSVHPFNYNNFGELENLVRTQDIGVIKMEVSRNMGPEDNFLHKVRKLASEKNIVLIFDECTSGFRQSLGGLHKIYGVEPDMAVFGKAMGNGYAITAVIGKREIMEAAQSTFISSTFWTERIGPTAALKTLEVMEKEKSWEKITRTGKDITSRWKKLAKKYDLSITTGGIPALTHFTFNSSKTLAYKTLITQQMLEKGFLAGNSVYVCIEHSPDLVSNFFEALDPIFGLIQECEEGRDIKSLLKGPECHDSFKRLN